MPSWQKALADSGVLDLLARFDPRIAGTLPLGVSLAGSDIDILCHAPEPNDVADCLWEARERLSGLVLRRWISEDRPLVATFDLSGWPVEVFASPVEVDRQAGWRHFIVEQRLLQLAGEALRERVMSLRHAGAKTEPAFATVLGLSGDPYAELYRLSQASAEELRVILTDMDLNDDAGREIKVELRRDLITAMKRGDKSETALLRQLVAALDNAEAVPLREERVSVDRHAFGDGSAEADRRVLSPGDVQALILLEMKAREEAVAEFTRLGEEARAAVLAAEIGILRRYVRR